MTIDIDAIRQRADRLAQMLSRSGDHPAAVSERAWEVAAEDVPALVAEVRRLRAENDELKIEHDELRHQILRARPAR